MTNPFNPRQQLGPPAQLPLDFDLDGHTYTVPELGTRTWLETLTLTRPGCWWQIIPGVLTGDGYTRLYTRMVSNHDDFDIDDLESVAEQVLPAVLGIDLDAARTLAGGIWGNWMLFDGWATTIGFDPLAQPIGRVLAAAYAWRRSLCSESAEISRLDAEIWTGGPATTVSGKSRTPSDEPDWFDAREEQAFLGFLDTVGARAG